ncbi:MAG: radical SAM protein [Sedimentisphaerales bacterium]|nr:radical SAM protein [Sedimentisphaerales bacterium]
MKPAAPSHRALRMLFWETTIRCNLTCAHCRRLESNDAEGADFSTDQAKALIGQLAELGRHQPQMPVLVFSGGEPLCREDLFDLVGAARAHEITCALATNGTLIDAAIAQRIRHSGIARASISLDGAGAETHDHMRQIPGAFGQAIRGIAYLHAVGVPFQINVTLTKQNAGQLEDVYELARSLGAVAIHIFMLVPVGCGLVLAETDMLSPQQYEEIMVRICELESRGDIQIKVTCGPHYERVKRQVARGSCPVPRVTDHGSRKVAWRDSACSSSAIEVTSIPVAICRSTAATCLRTNSWIFGTTAPIWPGCATPAPWRASAASAVIEMSAAAVAAEPMARPATTWRKNLSARMSRRGALIK